jgi:hypothetical protein
MLFRSLCDGRRSDAASTRSPTVSNNVNIEEERRVKRTSRGLTETRNWREHRLTGAVNQGPSGVSMILGQQKRVPAEYTRVEDHPDRREPNNDGKVPRIRKWEKG